MIDIGRRAGASLIDPFDSPCRESTCSTIDASGEPNYMDGGHRRPSYVRENVHYLDNIVLPES